MDNKNRAVKIVERLQEEYPDAGTMLEYNSAFELLVAVILSAQSTDEQVNRVTGELFKVCRSPQDFIAIDLEQLEILIKGAGLYKNKARNLKKMAAVLLEKHQGQVPASFDALMELPGVGRKSANVILAVAFNQPGLGVDTHVNRVANRLGLVADNKPDRIEKALKELLPQELWSLSHHLLIFHGRRVCRAKKPDCSQCSVENLCPRNIL